MAGKAQKPRDQLQFKRGGRGGKVATLGAVPDRRLAIPPAPQGIHPVARRAWREFWRSPISQLTDPNTDGAALRRWVLCVSERQHAIEAYQGREIVLGSMGQDALNPLIRYAQALGKEIQHYEEQFGMSPLARMRLGIALGQAQATIADLQRRLDEPRARDEPDVIDLGELG